MIINFTFVLIIGGAFALLGFILMLRGSKWIKPWGKQYKIINYRLVLIGLTLFILGLLFIVWQAGIRQ
ncbi:hypothetical protein JK162_10740 [Leuconostoc pseudomesenteroides]|jgi:hypothetical protein|uniref:hypothetical protein n=1 Tax=Leuconostoc pseudomesenteroides TaxID=33968 RepID=UPI001B8D500C|nr:hypothetical protein [Leuconostoc pseudomesenteroides]MBS0958935.1 hypothetical protein [Leuconostoc pseudomesenteroides]